MKLVEFINKLKDYKKEITDMPALEKIDPTKCAICEKKFKPEEKPVSDVSGVMFHQDCFDKAANNDELKARRIDNQLPYDEGVKLGQGLKNPPKGYIFANHAKIGNKVSIWSNVPKNLKLGQIGTIIAKDGNYITVKFNKDHKAEFYPNELIMKG